MQDLSRFFFLEMSPVELNLILIEQKTWVSHDHGYSWLSMMNSRILERLLSSNGITNFSRCLRQGHQNTHTIGGDLKVKM